MRGIVASELDLRVVGDLELDLDTPILQLIDARLTIIGRQISEPTLIAFA